MDARTTTHWSQHEVFISGTLNQKMIPGEVPQTLHGSPGSLQHLQGDELIFELPLQGFAGPAEEARSPEPILLFI